MVKLSPFAKVYLVTSRRHPRGKTTKQAEAAQQEDDRRRWPLQKKLVKSTRAEELVPGPPGTSPPWPVPVQRTVTISQPQGPLSSAAAVKTTGKKSRREEKVNCDVTCAITIVSGTIPDSGCFLLMQTENHEEMRVCILFQ